MAERLTSTEALNFINQTFDPNQKRRRLYEVDKRTLAYAAFFAATAPETDGISENLQTPFDEYTRRAEFMARNAEQFVSLRIAQVDAEIIQLRSKLNPEQKEVFDHKLTLLTAAQKRSKIALFASSVRHKKDLGDFFLDPDSGKLRLNNMAAYSQRTGRSLNPVQIQSLDGFRVSPKTTRKLLAGNPKLEDPEYRIISGYARKLMAQKPEVVNVEVREERWELNPPSMAERLRGALIGFGRVVAAPLVFFASKF